MANTLKFGNGQWATKEGSTLAYNDENGNFKPLPFNFERDTTATRVNKQGLIEIVTNNEPRIDFLNDSKGALLLEPSRTNKVTTSNDFNGSGWNISNLTVTSNQVISPDGTLNASKLEMTGDGSLRNQSEAFFNNGYAYSIFVKKGNSRYVTIRSAFFTQSFNCGFDLDTLTSEANGKIEDYGNDWYRLSILKNISGDVDRSGFFYLYLPNSLGSQTSVSGNYIYAYGGQIEDGSYATSYIPTQGSVVTRVADVCNGAGNEQVFNDSEGVLFAEISALADGGSTRRWSISDGSYSNRITLELDEASNTLKAFVISADTTSYSPSEVLSDITNYNKVAIKYKQNDFALWINGFEFDVDNSGDTPINLSKMQFADGNGTDAPFYGKTKQLQYFDTALSNAELQALTS